MASPPHRPRALQRWTNHLALWVMLGSVTGAEHCRTRSHAGAAPRPDARPDLASPRRVEATPLPVGRVPRRSVLRHVVGL